MKSPKTQGIISIVLGVLIAVTPTWILPVCDQLLKLANGKEVPMRCFWTARAEMLIGGLLAFTGILLITAKSSETQQRLSHQIAFLGLAAIATPLILIPTCASPDMPCNVGTKPTMIILGSLVIFMGLYGSFFSAPKLRPTGT